MGPSALPAGLSAAASLYSFVRGYRAVRKPNRLYDISDLLEDYDPTDRLAFVKSWDFRTYQHYVGDGAATPRSLEARLAQAEHDARIAQPLKDYLDQSQSPN